VSQLGLFRAKKTVREAKRILELFGKHFSGTAMLLDHMGLVQKDGLSLRTISNHITRIGALLRRHRIVDLLSNDDKPKYDEQEVEAYDSDQLTALFAAASPEERMLFQFFLGTGFRTGGYVLQLEDRRLQWEVITVKSKPELGFLCPTRGLHPWQSVGTRLSLPRPLTPLTLPMPQIGSAHLEVCVDSPCTPPAHHRTSLLWSQSSNFVPRQSHQLPANSIQSHAFTALTGRQYFT
jgi:hypothetical protein